jgi:hypothetical protein
MNMNTDLDPAFGNVADYLANEIKLADKTVLDAIPRRQDALERMVASEPQLFLRGCACAEDWRQARRVAERLGLDEAATRIVVRAIAKGVTRGKRDALTALGHDTSHLYEPAR